jgi:hypothetical protein
MDEQKRKRKTKKSRTNKIVLEVKTIGQKPKNQALLEIGNRV